MSGVNTIKEVAYGLSTALINVPGAPIISNRAPLPKDKAALGTIWVNKVANEGYVLTSVVAGSASWIALGGAGSFTNVVASGFITAGTTITAGTGITSTTGNITATTGDIIAGGALVCSAGLLVNAGGASITLGDLNVVDGDIIVVNGFIEAAAGAVAAQTLYSASDLGGVVSSTGITNVINTTQSTGALSILSTTANPGNNAGFLKFYVGTTVAYVPYFTNIAP